MEGKVAVVTGGAEGMGKALAMKFLEQQAKGVAIIDFNEDKGKATVQELQNQYGDDKVLFVRCDVKSKLDMEGAFDQVMRTFGHLNVVCNNAGIYDEINWEETVDTNLKGVIRGTYLAVQHMGTKHGGDGGIVINTASSNGFIVNPVSPVYGTTKHAVIAFTRNVAGESMFVENNVHVAACCPGKVFTPMHQKAVCRYMDEFKEMISKNKEVPMSFVTDAVLKLITESDKMNGVVCAVLQDNPMKIVEISPEK